jgi:GNAT superfamily N-acetyltransferase
MIDAANYSATETFRDGRAITIRAERPEDLDDWRAALARTSAETRYFRFFAAKARFPKRKPAISSTSTSSSKLRWSRSRTKDGRPTLIRGARYYVVEPGKAEIAFGLIDEYQAKGIGSVLVRHLAALAREAGELLTEVVSDNLPMLV